MGITYLSNFSHGYFLHVYRVRVCALYIYLVETPGSCIFVDNVYEKTSQSGGKNSAFHEFMKYCISIHLHSSYNNISLKFLLLFYKIILFL